jgi:protein-L-isoaspartate(D-aspartate) O-methyltransferase
MTAAAKVAKGDRVLEIGTGSGYQAAVLSALGAKVYTIEIRDELAKRTRAVFAKLGLDDIELKVGDGYYGWPDAAPFDAILVTAATPRIPPLLVEQLKIGGRIVIPLGTSYDQYLEVFTRESSGLTTQTLFEVRFGIMRGQIQARDADLPAP